MPCLIPITVHTEALSGGTIGLLSLRGKKYERACDSVSANSWLQLLEALSVTSTLLV